MTSEAIILDTPEKIRGGRLLILRKALHLELLGMKRRGPSAFSLVKREFGLRGNRKSVYTQFCELVAKETGV